MIKQDKTLVTDTHVYFLNGPFSQWYMSEFTVSLNGKDIKFNCAEQFMMASKASLFNDHFSFSKIMEADTPRKQKELGRGITPFDADQWNKWAKSFVCMGNYAKFTQNPNLKDYLLSSGDRYLVEGAHYDKVWGVGLAWDDPAILDQDNWQGTNWLGEALMTVRSIIRNECG